MSELVNANRVRNVLIAFAAITLSIAVFFGLQTQTSSVSLEAQAQKAVPMDIALHNGKPTITEFYANWCTSCQAMAPELAQLKEKYGNSVNFTMLNVDNNKWLPEILRYRVDGIPLFVFMNDKGEAIAQTIGEQPTSIMEANLDALIAHKTLPYANSTGQISDFKTPVKTPSGDPRSHGAQVQS
ncbi:MAG: thioredoxin family protein [Cyanobacteria bacterium P01_G01_bin.49]